MPNPIFRYPVDLTGINYNNLVQDEVHTLVNLPNRALIPTYAPYFTESLIVRDHISNALLVKGTHYQCLQLVEEATIKTGKEVCEIILITDSNVSNEVRISYQTIGGLYQRTSSAILAMYNAAINDNRPVDWSNVLGKPGLYPPSLHMHLYRDIIGFEPMIVEMERLRNALVLSDVPAFEALIDWFNSRLSEQGTIVKEVIMIKPDRFMIDRGTTLIVDLESVNIEDPYNYYWTIEHIDTSDTDFTDVAGLVNLKTGFNSFNLYAKIPATNDTPREFKINIRTNGINGDKIFTSGVLTLRQYTISDYVDMMYQCTCLLSPQVNITPETLFISDRHPC